MSEQRRDMKRACCADDEFYRQVVSQTRDTHVYLSDA
jgi:hypothetical protein